MKDAEDLWLELYREHMAWGRHHEQQRTSITGTFVTLAGGIMAVVTLGDCIDRPDLAPCGLLVGVSVFGALFSLKQHARSRLHVRRAKFFRENLDRKVQGADLAATKSAADLEAEGPILSNIRLGILFAGLHLVSALLGLLLILGILCGWFIGQPGCQSR